MPTPIQPIVLDAPVEINLPVPAGRPARTVTVSRFRPMFRVDSNRQEVVATIPPVPGKVLLWSGAAFKFRAGDTEEQFLVKLTTIMGADKAAFLQGVADGNYASSAPVDPQTQAAWNAFAAAWEALPPGKRAMWEPVRIAVADYILAGEFQQAMATIQTAPIPAEYEADRTAFLALFGV